MLLLLQAAATDDADDVMEDLRGAADLRDATLERLRPALSRAESAREQLLANRMRNSFLPILTSSRFAIDLRVIQGIEAPVALPVVTTRFEFDEPVSGGGRAFVFQLNERELEILIAQLSNVQSALQNLQIPGDGVRVIHAGSEAAR
ncbi:MULTISPECIES: hypothetical protein [unclassified Rathayibacter]|uniref:hypothetical protein n=1 Tax=unclassified Rathayibacter TaxID=2609250 RepID=UPI001044FD0C|nr:MULTISPECIES: hypothetical protein [unclassified Rathayibacter]MCJ1705638.1 hypothetical protein [Rathayibacter sp. VKM Ac-2926]